MARIRSIKPEFFTSLSIASLSIPARLHFVGLWTHADDDGRAIDDPRLLKAAIWPLDDTMTAAKVEKLQEELAASGRIVRYQADGKKVLQVVGWQHQKIDRRRPSTLPAFDETSTNQRRDDDEASSPDLGILGSRDLDLDLPRHNGFGIGHPQAVDNTIAADLDLIPISAAVRGIASQLGAP